MALEVEEIDITPYHPSPGYVELAFSPVNANMVAVDPVGGPAQLVDRDFKVIGNQLIWNHGTLPLSDIKGVLDDGHNVVVRVVYER